MSYKRTLIFLIVFAALAGFFYAYEIRGGEKRKEAEQKAKLLLSFKPNDVTTLTLTKTEQHVVAKKENGKWNIAEPVTAPADQPKVDQMLKTLADLKYERDLGAQTDIESFGLSKPEAEIEVAGPRGNLGKLLLGTSTPDGANFYVKRAADQQVYTASKSARGKIDLALFDMRDKTVFDFSPPDVKSLTVSHGASTVKLEKKSEGEWQITSPEEHAADAAKITGLLDSIKFAKVKKFVEEDAADLAAYGLANPSARLELAFGDKTGTLSFGKTGEPDSKNVYAARNDQRQVVELDADILAKLAGDVDVWRDKRLVRFEIPQVSKLEVKSPEGRIVVERPSTNTEEWKLTEPKSDLADGEKVGSLLSELQNAKALRFLKASDSKATKAAERALENPLITVSLWEKDKETPINLLISKSNASSDVFARAEGGEISLVAEQLLNKLSVSPGDMSDKSVIRFKAEDVKRIEVTHGEKSFKISRSDVQWDMPKGLNIEPYKIDQFLWDLREMKYKTIGPKEQDDKSYGFDAPTLTITLWGSDENKPMRVLVGKKIPEKNLYYVLANEAGQAMQVEDTHISGWLEEFWETAYTGQASRPKASGRAKI